MMTLAGGFILGLAGSIHCAAMCGPLVMAMVPRRNSRGAAIYHASRLVTYGLLGIAAGGIGHGVHLAGLGKALSIIAGITLIAAAVDRTHLLSRIGPGRRLVAFVRRAAPPPRLEAPRHSAAALASAGGLNALLPCGLVYGALTTAAAFGDIRTGFFFMVAFGAGTLPVLTGVWLLARSLPGTVSRRFRVATPVALTLVGMLLIVRGLFPAPSHGADGHRMSSRAHVTDTHHER